MPRTATVIISAIVIASFPAPSVLAATRDIELPEGPFDTRGEIEAACGEAVGVETITTSEGERYQPRLYFLRRCISSVTKREANRKRGERRAARRSTVHSRLEPRVQERVEKSTTFLRSQLHYRHRLRRRQAISPRRASNLLRDIRSANRRAVRQGEQRSYSDRRQSRIDANEAYDRCREERGLARNTCIREELENIRRERAASEG